MIIIFADDAAWISMQKKITRIDEAVALIAAQSLPPDVQAKLNKIFDTATGDSAKIDTAISPPKP